LFESGDIRKEYELRGVIGFPGSFGEVRDAVHIKSGNTVAVKSLKRSTASNTLPQTLRNEITIMKMTSGHEFIAAFIAAYESKKRIYIVMEKYDGGDLFDLVVAKGGRFNDEREAVRVVRQILEGIRFLHEKHIAHCDIKLSNILLTDDKKDIKIIDFGVSQIVQEGEMLHAEVGSPSFIAPEVLMGSYNEECDMWSLGCVVFILLFGFNPFNPKAIPALPNKEIICESILKGFSAEVRSGYGAFFPSKIPVSDDAKDFISNLLTLDWRHRMNAQEALSHRWLSAD
jgi:serine/threonine protein kinase